MRHRNHSSRLGKTTSHREAMMRNMAKSFIMHERIETTIDKAKQFKKVIEPLITLSKENTLTNRRRVESFLGLHYNRLDPKEARLAKQGDTSAYNDDRNVINKLFNEIGPKFKERQGGYTRIVRTMNRLGDAAPCCIIESV